VHRDWSGHRETLRDRLDMGYGGRDLVGNAVRLLVIAALLVVFVVGVTDIVGKVQGYLPHSQAPRADAGPTFPSAQAEAFAVRFALVYLTYDSLHADARAQALSNYLASSSSPNFGWDGSGKQTAVNALPAGIDVQNAGQARVTVAVLTDDGRWLYLSVPVAASADGLSVYGLPALVPPPTRAPAPSNTGVLAQDEALSAQLGDPLKAFFTAYGRSDATELGLFAAPGATFSGLNGAVTCVDVTGVTVYQGAPTYRYASATVRWRDAHTHAMFDQPYLVELYLVNTKWLVARVAPN
jgi:hypothetical protein